MGSPRPGTNFTDGSKGWEPAQQLPSTTKTPAWLFFAPSWLQLQCEAKKSSGVLRLAPSIEGMTLGWRMHDGMGAHSVAAPPFETFFLCPAAARVTMNPLRYTRACLDAAQRWPPPAWTTRIDPRGPKSVRVFELGWIERIFAQAHPITPILWYGPIVVIAAYRALKADSATRLFAVLLFFSGWLAWSLVEYLLHRFIFHMDAETPKQRLRAFLMHGYHHQYPNDKMRLVAPPLMSWPLGLVLAVITRWMLGAASWLPPYAGLATGYLAYDYLHYYAHHFRPRRGLGKWLRKYHMLHHHTDRKSRFGVSSPLWDIVFNTYAPVRGPVRRGQV
jgi:sterol desaturase/sphingolipid hydroxylase (fatty acid hydroxylase superfamily)